jgi:hypothetical protein
VITANEGDSNIINPFCGDNHGELRRSERKRKPASRLMEEPLFGCKAICSNAFQCLMNQSYSFAFPTTLADNNTYFYSQAMQQPDHQDFIKAMVKEVDDLFDTGVWRLCRRSDLGIIKTIKTVWSFKRKRLPDGTIT